MTYIHESEEFEALLAIVAEKMEIGEALIEKDYWVTHTLWAIQHSGLEIYFKGGTSLLKGFHLIERFSEDIDAWVKRGMIEDLPEVTHWTRTSKGHVQSRKAFYEALPEHLEIPGATIELDPESFPEDATSALFFVHYPGMHLRDLTGPNRPYIQLEVGYTEIIPNVQITISSFVHDYLEKLGRLEDFKDNRPHDLPTVHPLSTLIEKLDAISRRYRRDGADFAPATFIRHYEDVTRIIRGLDALPPLEESPRELAAQMHQRKQIRWIPSPDDDAFVLENPEKKRAVEGAHAAIEHMFWGKRIPLDETNTAIRRWLKEKGFGAGTDCKS